MKRVAQHGDRVGAFMSADDKTVYLLGYGIYEKDELVEYLPSLTFEEAEKTGAESMKLLGMDWPPELDSAEKRFAKFEEFKLTPLYLLPRTHPKLVLDHGDVIYGNECHFGPEELVKAMIGTRRIQWVVLSRNDKGEPEQETMAGTA